MCKLACGVTLFSLTWKLFLKYSVFRALSVGLRETSEFRNY